VDVATQAELNTRRSSPPVRRHGGCDNGGSPPPIATRRSLACRGVGSPRRSPKESEKGQANGYTSLDGSGLSRDAQIVCDRARHRSTSRVAAEAYRSRRGPSRLRCEQAVADSDLTDIAALNSGLPALSLGWRADHEDYTKYQDRVAIAARTSRSEPRNAEQGRSRARVRHEQGDRKFRVGNAGTATALQTARTIDGQSFEGRPRSTVIAQGITLRPG